MTTLEFTEFAINNRGRPIRLDNRPWIPPIYNIPLEERPDGTYRRKILLLYGRQSEKSTTIGNVLLSLANLIPHLRILYVTASDPQMREFSDERLRAITQDSPILSELAGLLGGRSAGTKETQNVQTKRWMNQSKINLRSVYRSADRSRGISSDVLAADELQDILVDVLPVLEEVLFHSELEGGPISYYAGTPKTFDNPLELYWSRYSTQNEWVCKCQACGHWNIIEIQNVGPRGLVCVKCRKDLDPITNGQWARVGNATAEWEGFRLPQPIVLYAYRDHPKVFEAKWADLLQKKKRYPISKLQNEVFARSYDSGAKPVSYDEVRRCCRPEISFLNPTRLSETIRANWSWAGIDYGTGTESYTILSIWGYDAYQRFCLRYAYRYEGFEADTDFYLPDIVKKCRRFNVRRIAADWGFGFQANPTLFKEFGSSRVLTYLHSGKQKEKVAYNGESNTWTTHRTRVLEDCFVLIRRGPTPGGVVFPAWDHRNEADQTVESFMNHILAVYQEHSESARELIYNHARTNPDDFLHSFCFAFLASQLDFPRPDIQAPSPLRR